MGEEPRRQVHAGGPDRFAAAAEEVAQLVLDHGNHPDHRDDHDGVAPAGPPLTRPFRISHGTLSIADDLTYTNPTDPTRPFEITVRDHHIAVMSDMIDDLRPDTNALAALRPALVTEGSPADVDRTT